MAILDWHDQTTPVAAADACLLAKGKPVLRDPAKITHVMLHQTACWYDVAPYQLSAAKGDEVIARHRRALGVHAHVTAMRHGSAVVAYSPAVYVNHGHNANEFSVGIEHEGHYDVDGNPVDMPKGVDVCAILEAGREALTWLREQLPNLRTIIAHRQSMRAGGNRTPKTSDPGARIFREVGVEHGVKRLGLTIDPSATWGIGRPLPANWYSNL